MQSIARFLVVLGIILIITGIVFLTFPKIASFRLPGDIIIRKGNFTFMFPIATCIVLSVILAIILNLFLRK